LSERPAPGGDERSPHGPLARHVVPGLEAPKRALAERELDRCAAGRAACPGFNVDFAQPPRRLVLEQRTLG